MLQALRNLIGRAATAIVGRDNVAYITCQAVVAAYLDAVESVDATLADAEYAKAIVKATGEHKQLLFVSIWRKVASAFGLADAAAVENLEHSARLKVTATVGGKEVRPLEIKAYAGHTHYGDTVWSTVLQAIAKIPEAKKAWLAMCDAATETERKAAYEEYRYKRAVDTLADLRKAAKGTETTEAATAEATAEAATEQAEPVTIEQVTEGISEEDLPKALNKMLKHVISQMQEHEIEVTRNNEKAFCALAGIELE